MLCILRCKCTVYKVLVYINFVTTCFVFTDHMGWKERSHWLVPQTVQGQPLQSNDLTEIFCGGRVNCTEAHWVCSCRLNYANNLQNLYWSVLSLPKQHFFLGLLANLCSNSLGKPQLDQKVLQKVKLWYVVNSTVIDFITFTVHGCFLKTSEI